MSSECYIKSQIVFFDPSLDGVNILRMARYYRPLLKLGDGYFTSCFFERIADGTGALKLGKPYEVVIEIKAPTEMESFFNKSIKEIFPVGDGVELVVLEKTIANGYIVALMFSRET